MPSKPLKKPRTTCFRSGKDLEIVQLSTGDWQVRGQGWVSTRLFQLKAQAEYWVSFSGGLPPDFPDPVKRVQVMGERAPTEDDVTPEVNAALRAGEELAQLHEEVAKK